MAPTAAAPAQDRSRMKEAIAIAGEIFRWGLLLPLALIAGCAVLLIAEAVVIALVANT